MPNLGALEVGRTRRAQKAGLDRWICIPDRARKLTRTAGLRRHRGRCTAPWRSRVDVAPGLGTPVRRLRICVAQAPHAQPASIHRRAGSSDRIGRKKRAYKKGTLALPFHQVNAQHTSDRQVPYILRPLHHHALPRRPHLLGATGARSGASSSCVSQHGICRFVDAAGPGRGHVLGSGHPLQPFGRSDEGAIHWLTAESP